MRCLAPTHAPTSSSACMQLQPCLLADVPCVDVCARTVSGLLDGVSANPPGFFALCRSDETYVLISAKDELLAKVAEDYMHPVRCQAHRCVTETCASYNVLQPVLLIGRRAARGPARSSAAPRAGSVRCHLATLYWIGLQHNVAICIRCAASVDRFPQGRGRPHVPTGEGPTTSRAIAAR